MKFKVFKAVAKDIINVRLNRPKHDRCQETVLIHNYERLMSIRNGFKLALLSLKGS